MDSSLGMLSSRTRLTIWLALLLLAALGWSVVIQQTRLMSAPGSVTSATNAPMGDTSDMASMPGMVGMGADTTSANSTQTWAMVMPAEPSSLLLYLPVWVAMMVAMMFPAAAPMVSLFAALNRNRRAAGQTGSPTWIFLAGYLFVWSLLGVGAYLLSLLVPALGMMAPGLRVEYPLAGGVVLIFAGLYQLTPLKQTCLQHCRSPVSVILHGWHDGPVGTFRMGFEHGAYCLGCCWGLMLVLLVVGLMNLVGMMILSVIIFVEKVVPYGALVSKFAAIALVAFGLATLLLPLLSRPAM